MIPISPRLIGAGVAVVLLFGAGWQVNGWRLNAKFAKSEAAAVAAFEERRAELLAEYKEKARRDQTARLALQEALDTNRTKTASLEEELARTTLTPTAPHIERVLIPGDCDNGQPTVVIANPFTDDFVRLWNDSAADSRP